MVIDWADTEEGPPALEETALAEARQRRAANPTMSPREVELLGEAEDLIRGLLGRELG